MQGYRRAWWGLTGLFTLLGMLVALQAVPGPLLVLLVLSLLTVGGRVNAVRARLRPGQPPAAEHGRRQRFAHALAVGAAAAVGGTGALGLTVLLGVSALPLLLLLVASSPAALAWYAATWPTTRNRVPPRASDGATRHRNPMADPQQVTDSPTPPQALLDPTQLTELATVLLCHRWRCSYLTLQHTTDVRARELLVQQRQLYLDELALRDPIAFARWLGDGARAASDPGPYLAPPEARG